MLHSEGGNIIDYNWVTHASNYWVCDGIIQGGGDPDQAWKDAAALHREIWLDDYTSNAILPNFFEYAFNNTLTRRWMFVADSTAKPVRWFFVFPGDAREEGSVPTDQSTSFFMANITTIPIDMFHQASKLRVLKLCRCAFSFSTPPFYCCQSLRFLGLDTCKDIIEAQSGEGERQEDIPTKNQAHEEQAGEKQERETTTMEFFQKLWVLDICSTDWTIPKNALDKMGKNIREINIRNGRVWGSSNFAWRRLGRNLHKLRVIEPISNWETGQKDEFMRMAKLELLDLTGNQDIQVLPNLSGAINLKTLVLDGCVGLEQVGPHQGLLPPSVESFSFDAGSGKSCKVSKISLEGCKQLEHFKLRGTFPLLQELDLSGTSVKKLNLSVVEVPKLERVFLMGCKQMRAVLWWPTYRKLEVLRIDTSHGSSSSSCLPPCIGHQMKYDAIVITGDARFIQSVWLQPALHPIGKRLYLNLHKPASSCSISKDKGRSSIKKNKIKEFVYHQEQEAAAGAIMVNSTNSIDIDASLTEGLAAAHDHDTMLPWSQPLDRHVEIGQGVSVTDVESLGGIKDVYTLLTEHIGSLHVHDNPSMTSSVNPKTPESARKLSAWALKSCCIQRCPKLQAVFASFGSGCYQLFERLETILAAHLLRAACIWSKGIIYKSRYSLENLKSVHVCFCPRLKFVLPLSEYTEMPRLEILHVVSCGDLRHIFPLDEDGYYLSEWRRRELVHDFPSLKRIYLHDLPSLEQVCELRMCAPALENITMRGCKSIRRLPALIDHPLPPRPVVNCEKDVWDSLEWDGLDAGPHPFLFHPLHPAFYRKKLPRGSLLL